MEQPVIGASMGGSAAVKIEPGTLCGRSNDWRVVRKTPREIDAIMSLVHKAFTRFGGSD